MNTPPTLKDAGLSLMGSLLVSTAKIAGVMLAVSVPLFVFLQPACGCTTKAHAYKAAMKSDLRNLVTAHESYYADHLSYTMSQEDLPGWSGFASQGEERKEGFQPSHGVSISIEAATPDGWSALASHAEITTQCAIFLGDVDPPAAEAREGEVYCWDDG